MWNVLRNALKRLLSPGDLCSVSNKEMDELVNYAKQQLKKQLHLRRWKFNPENEVQIAKNPEDWRKASKDGKGSDPLKDLTSH